MKENIASKGKVEMVGSLQPLAFPHLHTASGTVHRSPPPCRRPRPLSPFWLSMRTIPKWPERHMHVHGNSNGVLVLANVAPTRHWLGFLVYGGGASKFPWQCRWGVCVCVCVARPTTELSLLVQNLNILEVFIWMHEVSLANFFRWRDEIFIKCLLFWYVQIISNSFSCQFLRIIPR